jgi:hypothetical protein
MTIPSPDLTARNLQALAERWAPNTASERAGFQSWMLDLLEALGADRPLPPTPEHQFELAVRVVDREGRESVNYVDYWKAGHVAVEAKDFGGAANDLGLRKAFGQVRNYVAHVPGTPPPYLMVVDVARTAIVWDRWPGAYGDFVAGRRICLVGSGGNLSGCYSCSVASFAFARTPVNDRASRDRSSRSCALSYRYFPATATGAAKLPTKGARAGTNIAAAVVAPIARVFR